MHPVFFGSAITGAGVEALIEGIAELLPAAEGDVDGPVSGAVFKVERAPAGEKIAYVRMFAGTVRVRDRSAVRPGRGGKVTAIERLRPRLGRPASVGRRGADRQAPGPRRRPDRRRDRRVASGPRAPPLRPADAGDGRRSPRLRRQGRAARRACPARRAGPADQRAPGRRPSGALRLALRRGAEGGHRGDAGERLRPRGRLPRDDDDLRRATYRRRRGRRAAPTRHVRRPPRFSLPLGCASSRPRSTRGCSLGWMSRWGRYRCTSTRRSRPFMRQWSAPCCDPAPGNLRMGGH